MIYHVHNINPSTHFHQIDLLTIQQINMENICIYNSDELINVLIGGT
jgi:hypothetical protein